MQREVSVVRAEVLDARVSLSLEELGLACRVELRTLVEMVEEGLIEPVGRGREQWQFTGEDVRRVEQALHLQEDLGVNVAGAALALELLEELEDLRAGAITLFGRRGPRG